jgi:hypothetical protein
MRSSQQHLLARNPILTASQSFVLSREGCGHGLPHYCAVHRRPSSASRSFLVWWLVFDLLTSTAAYPCSLELQRRVILDSPVRARLPHTHDIRNLPWVLRYNERGLLLVRSKPSNVPDPNDREALAKGGKQPAPSSKQWVHGTGQAPELRSVVQ